MQHWLDNMIDTYLNWYHRRNYENAFRQDDIRSFHSRTYFVRQSEWQIKQKKMKVILAGFARSISQYSCSSEYRMRLCLAKSYAICPIGVKGFLHFVTVCIWWGCEFGMATLHRNRFDMHGPNTVTISEKVPARLKDRDS